jgi:hypothetical protein
MVPLPRGETEAESRMFLVVLETVALAVVMWTSPNRRCDHGFVRPVSAACGEESGVP